MCAIDTNIRLLLTFSSPWLLEGGKSLCWQGSLYDTKQKKNSAVFCSGKPYKLPHICCFTCLISPKWLYNLMIPGWTRKLLIQIALCCIPAPCLQRIWYPQRCQKKLRITSDMTSPSVDTFPLDIFHLKNNSQHSRLENPLNFDCAYKDRLGLFPGNFWVYQQIRQGYDAWSNCDQVMTTLMQGNLIFSDLLVFCRWSHGKEWRHQISIN